MKSIRILNLSILSVALDTLLLKLDKGILFTPNVDHLIKLQKDRDFFEAYGKADWIICDSKILNLGAKILRTPFQEVIPGSSFFPAYYNYHRDNNKIKIFLLGAADGVALTAMEKINNKVGRQIVVGAHSPSFGFEQNETECQEIVALINQSEANVLVVGVGAPKQEKWITAYKGKLPGIDLFMALGATIDFEAGNIKRAPFIMRKLALEWLFRLTKEPRRLWKRYLYDDLPFFSLVLKQKAGKYIAPFVGNK